jgi:hypothetical protein
VIRTVSLNGDSFRYAPSLEKALTYRDKVGSEPVVIEPERITDDGIFIVSEANARLLASLDQTGDFLRYGHVIVVY